MRGPGLSFIVVPQVAPSSFHARQQCLQPFQQQPFQQRQQ